MTLVDGLAALRLSPGSAIAGVHELLDSLGPWPSLPSGEYADLARETDRAIARLQGLRLKVLAAADKARVAADAGAASTAAWHAAATHTDPAEAARQNHAGHRAGR